MNDGTRTHSMPGIFGTGYSNTRYSVSRTGSDSNANSKNAEQLWNTDSEVDVASAKFILADFHSFFFLHYFVFVLGIYNNTSNSSAENEGLRKVDFIRRTDAPPTESITKHFILDVNCTSIESYSEKHSSHAPPMRNYLMCALCDYSASSSVSRTLWKLKIITISIKINKKTLLCFYLLEWNGLHTLYFGVSVSEFSVIIKGLVCTQRENQMAENTNNGVYLKISISRMFGKNQI